MDALKIEDLRRRLDQDPASIAFAQLAEEYRRAGNYDEAVRVCRAGLARHPAYISARVTLGRALFELERLDQARAEFARVLEVAPENAVARGMLSKIDQHTRLRGDRATREQIQPSSSGDDFVLRELEAWLDVVRQTPSR